MRDDVVLNKISQMLLMVSMATNKTIQLVVMYHDVWFVGTMEGQSYFCLCEFMYSLNSHNKQIQLFVSWCIHTSTFWGLCCIVCINIHKKELFVIAIWTPTGKTFPGNFTIIPSAKKWIFHAIFRLAFLSYVVNTFVL
jgi:hypothetical protein